MIDRALRNPYHNPRYAYIAPTYSQAKRIAWDMMKDYTKNIPWRETREQELRVDIPRRNKGDNIQIRLLGAENPDSIRGIYLDGCIMDEFAQCASNLWGEVVLPTLTPPQETPERKGWAIFIGTPKGQNHFFDKYMEAKEGDPKQWFHTLQKASSMNIIFPEELQIASKSMSHEEFLQEYECSFTAALKGSFYKEEFAAIDQENRITDLPYDPQYAVHTAWDIGTDDSTVIWFFQKVQNKYHIIDYYENNKKGIPHYVKVLKERPYVYGEHILPHDASNMDFSTGRLRVDTFREHGLRVKVLKKVSFMDGIEAARLILPLSVFNGYKCKAGINALRNYESTWDNKNNTFKLKPIHNWASHAADAWRYLALGSKWLSDRAADGTERLHRQAQLDYDYFGGMS
jgi:hypothetical protein